MFVTKIRFVTIVLLGAILSCSAICAGNELTAFAEPYQDIDVASPEMGTLASIHVKEGDRVSAGQLLAGLDEQVMQAALKMARTAMEARGKLQSAQAELRQHSARLKKLTALKQRRHASQEEVDRAQAQVEIATAQVQAVREELQVKSAEFERIQAQLEQKRIKSPIDGVVTRVFRDTGEFVSAADPVVAKVVQLDPLSVVFSVPTPETRKLQVGQTMPLRIGVQRDKVDAVIEFVSPTSDAQSGTARVKLRIPNSQGKFQSGDGCWLPINAAATSSMADVSSSQGQSELTKSTSLRMTK